VRRWASPKRIASLRETVSVYFKSNTWTPRPGEPYLLWGHHSAVQGVLVVNLTSRPGCRPAGTADAHFDKSFCATSGKSRVADPDSTRDPRIARLAARGKAWLTRGAEAGVFLPGDAAPLPPTGIRMTAVQDTATCDWKVQAVLRVASESLLDSYGAEPKAGGRWTARAVRAQPQRNGGAGWLVDPKSSRKSKRPEARDGRGISESIRSALIVGRKDRLSTSPPQ